MLTDEQRKALEAAMPMCRMYGLASERTHEAIFLAGTAWGAADMRERAAKVADEFDFGLDSLAGLVRDIRAIPVDAV